MDAHAPDENRTPGDESARRPVCVPRQERSREVRTAAIDDSAIRALARVQKDRLDHLYCVLSKASGNRCRLLSGERRAVAFARAKNREFSVGKRRAVRIADELR